MPMPVGLSTIRDFVRWGASRFQEAGLFYGHGTDNCLDEAAALVLHAIHLPYDFPLAYFDARLTAAEQEAVVTLLRQRVGERKPAAYLTRDAFFAGHRFYVDERVLIPRSPIAELIEQQFEPWLQPERVNQVLDLCTGSGCIAIACALAFPQAQIRAVDISAEALAVAAINVEDYGLTERVKLIRSDLFNALERTRFDLIVSNPPYVGREEWEGLPPEYHSEPKLGFYGGESGLDCVQRLLAEAGDFLSEEGILVVEVGNSAEALQQRFPEVPFLWLEFERGGEGVFLLRAEQLAGFRELFAMP